jgi:hypothetical protein
MQELNIPTYPIKIRKSGHKTEVFDNIRKKYVVLTPEEEVRQRFILYLIHEKNYPATLISVEKGLKVNGMFKRFDAVVSDRKGNPAVLIEFKSPKVSITQKVFDQISNYNLLLKVEYLIVSNGLKHYCCRINHKSGLFTFLKDIPDYDNLTTND